jgi:hypothetical protein
MRALLAAVILIAASLAPAHAGNEFSNAADFLKAWDTDNNNLYLRIYIRGVGDGMGFYNTAVGLEGGKPLYCPPEKVGLVDAQYVAIMRNYLTKWPNLKNLKQGPVSGVLIFALKDAFPCGQ